MEKEWSLEDCYFEHNFEIQKEKQIKRKEKKKIDNQQIRC
jgi:hypothetical protein